MCNSTWLYCSLIHQSSWFIVFVWSLLKWQYIWLNTTYWFVIAEQQQQQQSIFISAPRKKKVNYMLTISKMGSTAMVGGMVQNSTNQNHYQHQQPICSSTFFFYINNKIRPTSTINIIINIRNMPNSTTRENQHQQKFLFSSTTICLTTNIGHRLQQQNTFNNLGTNDWLWSREVGTQKF